MSYLRNAWYVGAWADELTSGTLIARTVLDEPLVLFRDAEGRPATLYDRCPHRFAPLSVGTLAEGVVTCRYHGLAFDGTGACVRNPHGPRLRSMAVRARPAVERHRAIWIWMGDPDRADPDGIPPLDYLAAAPRTAFSAGHLLSGPGGYQVFTDNLLDLSHTDYLHPDTLGGGAVTKAKQRVEETAEHLEVTWHAKDAPPSPLLRSLLNDIPDKTDFVQKVRWYAPSVMRLIAATIEPGQLPAEGYANTNAHILTPETETTTHYFFAATRNYAVDDEALNQRIAETRARIFATEDKPMIEEVQRRMGDGDFWDLKPLLLPVDEASVRVRRRLDKLIAAEREAEPVGR